MAERVSECGSECVSRPAGSVEQVEQVQQKAKLFPDVHADPRCDDFPEDSRAWVRLFELVQEMAGLWEEGVGEAGAGREQRGEQPGEIKIAPAKAAHLYGHLKYMRIMGTRLQRSQQWGFVLVPEVGEDAGGWESRERYERGKRILDPFRGQVVQLLGKLGREDK